MTLTRFPRDHLCFLPNLVVCFLRRMLANRRHLSVAWKAAERAGGRAGGLAERGAGKRASR